MKVGGCLTQFGFRWGPVEVTRLAYFPRRGVLIGIKTEHVEVEVHVSEKGRKINVYRNGRELIDPWDLPAPSDSAPGEPRGSARRGR